MRKPAMHSIWLVLVLSVLSSSVRAGTLGDLTYEIADGEVAITRCNTSAAGELVIPDEIEGLPVTIIRGTGDPYAVFEPFFGAFSDCTNLTSITIPDSVTSIGIYAFAVCSSLTSITIPEGVTSIGWGAFAACESLTSIIIPDSVASIGFGAFLGCSSLTSIDLPDMFQSAGELWRMRATAALIFGENDLLSYAQGYNQTVITGCETAAKGDLVIPAEIGGLPVTSIAPQVFSGRRRLKSITIPEGVTSIGGSAFAGCSRLKSITIPDSVTSIGDRAFWGCRRLKSITLPDSVISIGRLAFWECRSLTSITIPDSVNSIGYKAFWGCRRLTSITIPDSVTSIGDRAFEDCRRLKSITIPDSVTSIGDGAFEDCRRLKSITIPEAFHSQSEANRLGIGRLWPNGFFLPSSSQVFLPSSVTRTPELSIRLPIQLVVTGDQNTQAVIEATDSANGPWTEWRTVIIGEEGTTEVDLDEGAEKRFYRVRD